MSRFLLFVAQERTLLNFAIFSILMLGFLFGVFGKTKWLNNTAEMKKTIVILALITFAIFICLYFFVKKS